MKKDLVNWNYKPWRRQDYYEQT